jgi:maltose alpha-D-glucosyltransferase/alpha-amylase
MEPWRELWCKWNSIYFLRAYLETCEAAPFTAKDPEEVEMLLDAYVLEKAMYELGYELNNRPDWVQIPVEGILEIMKPG